MPTREELNQVDNEKEDARRLTRLIERGELGLPADRGGNNG